MDVRRCGNTRPTSSHPTPSPRLRIIRFRLDSSILLLTPPSLSFRTNEILPRRLKLIGKGIPRNLRRKIEGSGGLIDSGGRKFEGVLSLIEAVEFPSGCSCALRSLSSTVEPVHSADCDEKDCESEYESKEASFAAVDTRDLGWRREVVE